MSGRLPRLQPGAKVQVYSIGTLGPIALTRSGDIWLITTSHQIGPMDKGAAMCLLPERTEIGRVAAKVKMKLAEEPARRIFSSPPKGHTNVPYDSSLRIKEVADDLPAVLKKPIKADTGRELVKSGAATMVTKGRIRSTKAKVTVQLSDRSVAKFRDQIMTDYMGTHGDSGSFVLTADTLEPVGLLFAGNQSVTYHNKLTNVAKLADLMGFYCPISLPSNTSLELRFLISSILPDGFFKQKANLYSTDEKEVLEGLGITDIKRRPNGEFDVCYKDAMLLDGPHRLGDEGIFISQNSHVIGLAVGGTENSTIAIKIHRMLEALNLELMTTLSNSTLAFLHYSGYWRARCKTCNSTIRPGSTCRFCRTQDRGLSI